MGIARDTKQDISIELFEWKRQKNPAPQNNSKFDVIHLFKTNFHSISSL